MPVWLWLIVGACSWFTLSLLVGVAVTNALRRIGGDASELLEQDPWAFAPLMRSAELPRVDDAEVAEEVAATPVAGSQAHR
jgi:hypothetical protein